MDSISAWWNGLPPFTRLLVGDAIAVVVALFGGGLLGGWVRGRLKEFGVDDLLNLAWRTARSDLDDKPGAGDLYSYLVDLTVWMFGVAFIAHQHQNKVLTDLVFTVVGRAWMLAISAFLATFLANAVGRAVNDLLKHPAVRDRLEALLPGQDKSGRTIVDTLAHSLSTLVFGFLFLLVIMTASELAGLPALGGAVAALWNLGLRLISVAAALGIGALGVLAVARAWPTAHSKQEQSYEEKVQGFTRLGLVAVTTILAVDLVTAAASTFTWVAVLFLLAVFLEPLRGSLLDIWAGFALEFYAVKKIKLGEAEATVEKTGFLQSWLRNAAGETFQLANREVLAAHMRHASGDRPACSN
jgi:hypothetical protein